MPYSDPMLPSQLQSIQYFTPSGHTDPLQFAWQGGGYGWDTAQHLYDLPVSLATPSGKTKGITFLDLNGDGRPELVQAQDGSGKQNAWTFTPGQGWTSDADWVLPANLADQNNNSKGTVLADFLMAMGCSTCSSMEHRLGPVPRNISG